MKDDLEKILIMVNDWLKYGEAKNAALLTVNGAGFFVLLQIFNSDLKIPYLLAKSLWAFSFFLVISVGIHFTSFLPRLQKEHTERGNSISGKENLYYFGSIAKYTATNYLHDLYKFYKDNSVPEVFPEQEKDLALQIVTNSKIAIRKYTLFKYGLYSSLMGLSFVIVGMISVGVLNLWRIA